MKGDLGWKKQRKREGNHFFFLMKTCYLVQGAAEQNQWKKSLIIIGVLTKDTCLLKKLCYPQSDKKLVIEFPGSEGCGYQRERVALPIFEVNSIPRGTFESKNTWYSVYMRTREQHIWIIIKVIKCVPQIQTKPVTLVATALDFPGIQLILKLDIHQCCGGT